MGSRRRQSPTPSVGWAVTVGVLALTGCALPHGIDTNPSATSSASSRLPLIEPIPGNTPPSSTRKATDSVVPTGASTSLPLLEPVPGNAPPAARKSTDAVVQAGLQVDAAPKPQPWAGPAQLPPPRELTPKEPKEPKLPNPPAGPSVLTLDQVINAVVVSDPRLRAGFEAINQANADALTASLPPNPSLYTDIQLLPLTRPFTVTAQGGPPQYDLQVTQPIDWFLFGKRAANMVVATRGVKVSEADFADMVRQRVSDAVAAFYDVLEAKALLDLARKDVENLEQVRDAIAKVVPLGKPRVDLNRVELDLLRARQTVRDAETTLVTAKAKLRAMLGRSDADPAFDVDGSLDTALNAEPPPLEEGFALAVRNRPDIESDRQKIARAGADITAQKRAAYPPVSPMFGYTRQFQRKAIGFPDADSWTAALTVGLPFYDRNQGNRLKAASTLAQNRFELAADLADLRAEVETAAQEFRAAKANAESVAADQLRLARDVLGSVTKSYQAGGQTLLDFLDAEREFRDTFRAYINSRAAYWRAVYRLAAAIGQKITP